MSIIRGFLKKIYNKNLPIIDRLFSFYQNSESIIYFNEFDHSENELFNLHYSKAKWFFKSNDFIDYKVYFNTLNENIKTPDFMEEISNEETLFVNKSSQFVGLLKSKNILVWKQKHTFFLEMLYIFIYFISGKRIFNININDIKSLEYSVYAKLPWLIMSNNEKKIFIEENYNKYIKFVESFKANNLKKGFVIANGPSLEDIFDIDLADGYKIVANSIVRNDKMMQYINPEIVVAGDPLWHFGPSKYSQEFRKDIEKTIQNNPNILFVFPEQGIVNYINMKNFRNNIVVIPYGKKAPNFDMQSEYYLPPYISVINSLMIPLMSTLADEIYILGSDGKVKHRPNEDFWAHAGNVQYSEELVECGHKCSPTFDINRKSHDEVKVVENTLTNIITIGEKKYNKKFFNLSKISTFDIMKKRTVR